MITGPTVFLTIILVILILGLPRRYLLVPFIVAACFVPAEQHLYLINLHFYVLRILIVAGVLRILMRGEYRPIKWLLFDKLVFAWALVGAGVYFLLRLNFAAVIYKSGVLMDIFGMYWIARQAIRSWDDVKSLCRVFAVCALILVPFVAIEWSTGRNPFLLLGRVFTAIRLGEFRCQASFPHSIIFGAFWACLVPMFLAMARVDRYNPLYWLAVAACTFMIIASHSSTPIGGLGAVLGFMVVFRYRHYGRHMAIAFFGSLVALHLVMNHPVWHLLSRVTIVGGSTGYHRFLLIEETVNHFREWALLGTLGTGHWGYQLFDVTNQFALEGIRGGLITLVLFVTLLFVAVRTTGWFSWRPRVPRDQQWLSWALCVSLIAHCVMFIGVSYFGQIQMLLYMTFALAGFAYEQNARLTTSAAPARVRVARMQPLAPAYPLAAP
jgi:hypothetical protein